jgi:hypothetical protein
MGKLGKMYPHASYKLNKNQLNNRKPTWCVTLKIK